VGLKAPEAGIAQVLEIEGARVNTNFGHKKTAQGG
jgi:hypothetical protein